MLTGPAADNLVAAVAPACRSGLDADALRAAVLPRLRKAVPVDALWWASADPATLLFTRCYREELPEDSGPYFVENEFLHQDVNKWTELARDPDGRAHADAGDRAATRPGATVTGTFSRRSGCRTSFARCCGSGTPAGATSACTARRRTSFSPDEARFVQRLAPHLAEGLRRGSAPSGLRPGRGARTDQVWSCSPPTAP